MNDLQGINVLVTGASNGIGKAIATHLIQNGARVAVHYNTNKLAAEQVISACKNDSKTYCANLEVEAEVIKLFKDVQEDFGKIDAMILNAGVFLEHSTELPIQDWLKIWKRTLAINLDAVGILTKLGIDHFKTTNGGRFIYIGSRAVFRGETEEYLAYAASKGGLTSLGRSVARSFGKYNIKSFILSPGFTRTQMAEQFISSYGEERILNEIALNALTTPEDLAPIVALMCSGKMDHATGATIDMNAGSHIR